MNHQRGKLFVDPSFQGRLLGRLATYWFLYHVVLWHMLFLFSLVVNALTQGGGTGRGVLELYREFAVAHVSIIVCFVVTLPLIINDMLKFSHRLVGPFIRFREVMKQMVEGKTISSVTMRPRDLPSDFLAVFNKLLTLWNQRAPRPDVTSDESQPELVESA